MERILTKINLFWAAAVTVLSAIFGAFWWVFVVFAGLNVLDYITGVAKARYYHKENSMAGVKGIIKKLSYWVIIGIAFFISYAFTQLGAYIGVDFGLSVFIGWFVFISFIINEIRSILENFVEMDCTWIPVWFIKGLEVANDKINRAAGGDIKESEEKEDESSDNSGSR